jgi:hypothetical protein
VQVALQLGEWRNVQYSARKICVDMRMFYLAFSAATFPSMRMQLPTRA